MSAITVRPGETVTVMGLPALPPTGPIDPGYSPPWAQVRPPVDPGYSPPWAQVQPPVDPGYSPPWAQVRPPVDPGYSPPWAQVPSVPIVPPTEPPPTQLPGDSGHWVWAWSPQLGRWVWVKVPGEGEAGPKA